MGGFKKLFVPDTPKAPRVPAPAPVVVKPDPAAEEEAARLAALERSRRGLAGTIVTGPRGARLGVADAGGATMRKTLLGQ